jgi:hypothetical protein
MLGATLLALSATAATAAAPSESTQIWRAQLTVGTCDATNAETSDPVKVKLNDTNMTVLNSPANDFTRGSTASFDLVPFNPVTGAPLRLYDVTKLQVRKDGSNGLMLCRLTLVINERTIYHNTWASPGYLLDDTSAGHQNAITITSSTLRASSYWQAYGTSKLPWSIPSSSTKRRIEALIATAMYGQDLYWRSSGVSVARRDSAAISVGVDLKEAVSLSLDPNFDIDFDLRFSCDSGIMQVRVEHYRAGTSGWQAVAANPLVGIFEAHFGDTSDTDVLEKSILPSGFSFKTATYQAGTCPVISVDSYGNVKFTS